MDWALFFTLSELQLWLMQGTQPFVLGCRHSLFDVDLTRASRNSQDVISFEGLHHDQDLAIDLPDDDAAAATTASRQPSSRKNSVVYTPGQQFLLLSKDLPTVLSLGADSALATEEEGLIDTAAVPTHANVAQLPGSDPQVSDFPSGTYEHPAYMGSPGSSTHWVDPENR